MKIAASDESPIIDPAFVVKDWGYGDVSLKVNGSAIERSKDFRVGHRERLEGTDLIVWFRYESTEPMTVEFTPAG